MQQVMTDATTMRAQTLTAQDFAPYGQVLMLPERPADIDKGWLGYWHTLAEVGFKVRPVWGWLQVRDRERILTELERHCGAHEVFIAMHGASLMAFATGGAPEDPQSAPDMTTLRIFRLEPGQAVVVGRGVWHTPGWPLGERADYLLALEEATPASDLDIRPVGPFTITE